jgi:GNAT superfamily N-acetyltransferase
VRGVVPADGPAVLELLGAALGAEVDEHYAAFFDWKHQQNPFGVSPAWDAVDSGRIVGFRTFMRWEFDTPQGVSRAVRAVDTATHPDHQGRGIFSLLTRAAIEELTADGVAFVFNTPNDRSRPGYLKMGWQVVDRLPTGLRPASLRALPRIAAARTAAERWSVPTVAALSVQVAFADEGALAALLERTARLDAMTTRRSPAYLRWRYGFAPLAYRVLPAGDSVAHGLLVFRLRRRGSALELVVADLHVPQSSATTARRLIRTALRQTGADYALGLRMTPAHGLLPLPGQGPQLTWRPLAASGVPSIDELAFSLGDIELF